MIATIVVVEEFTDLPWSSMSTEQKQGALLLFNAVMTRVEPLLPHTPDMAHVFDGIAKARNIAAAVMQLNEDIH
jgi:hypothetical protein